MVLPVIRYIHRRTTTLFDHLVGEAEQGGIKSPRPLAVLRLMTSSNFVAASRVGHAVRTLQDARNIDTGLPPSVGEIGTIAGKPAFTGLDLSILHGGNPVLARQRNEAIGDKTKKGIVPVTSCWLQSCTFSERPTYGSFADLGWESAVSSADRSTSLARPRMLPTLNTERTIEQQGGRRTIAVR